jgi:hypothetical protein
MKGLEQLLGLKAGPGRPSRRKPGKDFSLALSMFLARSTKNLTRKSKKGEPTPKPWKQIARDHGLKKDSKSARKIVERELPHIEAHLGKQLIARLRNNHPIRKNDRA